MQTEQLIFNEKGECISEYKQDLKNSAQLAFIFGATDLIKNQEIIKKISKIYPNAYLAGCSTAGEIAYTNISNNQLILTAVKFEKTNFKVSSQKIDRTANSFEIGKNLAKELVAQDLRHIFVISDGLKINGSQLTEGFNFILKGEVPLTGGLAGDSANFKETWIVNGTSSEKEIIIAIGFYGDSIITSYGSRGGWDSFGVDRLVTKSKDNVLYELDNQPALELYKKYLGKYASELPSSALLFPLSIRSGNDEDSVVRTILSVDESTGSMTFAGDIPEGQYVRLMKASHDKLVDGATAAAEKVLDLQEIKNPDLLILISCVGRKLVLKQRTEEEIETINETMNKPQTITGFYSYGEICPSKQNENCLLHNQTMTITAFKEIL